MSNVNIQIMQTPPAAPTGLFAATVKLQGFALTIARAFTVDHTRIYSLNGHVLRDIGITRQDIGNGPAVSFWRD
jgi:hypothetical protein